MLRKKFCLVFAESIGNDLNSSRTQSQFLVETARSRRKIYGRAVRQDAVRRRNAVTVQTKDNFRVVKSERVRVSRDVPRFKIKRVVLS